MTQYNESSIRVLSDIEHVRTRPLMYISSERPLYQMFTEIFDNAVDEAMNGFADTVYVDINYDTDEVTIRDNGRGLPQGLNPDLQKPTPIVIFTKLNSGGKYDVQTYKKSGGLHGVGSTVVNALSEELRVRTWRGNDIFTARFQKGVEAGHNQTTGVSESPSGTEVYFKPDKTLKLLENQKLQDYRSDIEEKMSMICGVLKNLTVIYNGSQVEGKTPDQFIPPIKEKLFDEAITFELPDLVVSMNWAEDTNKSQYKAYCNSLNNPNGGDHERGVYKSLVEVLGNDDVVLGLHFFVSVFYPEVEYDSQAKLKAVSKDMQKYVIETLTPAMKSYFKKNKEQMDAILALAKHKRSELEKRNNKSNIRRDRKSAFLNALGVAGFSDASTKNRAEAELYIVEGNSAAGSALQARNTRTQAILPLRGKTINSERASVADLLKNAEISTLVSSIDAGIFEDVNIAKSRYGKIIIMTDADDDGKDIAVSLIGFFVKCMTEFVEKGYVYLALPPLYGITINKQFVPINDEATKEQYLAQGHKITRFKGLGEMNPEQLEVACMNPATRNLIQLTLSPECKQRISEILGGDSEKRKEILRAAGVLA